MQYETIKPYIEKRLVTERKHPKDPNLSIFCYTKHCMYESAWDEVTMQCRGLILNTATGEIVARPFKKFFTYGQFNISIPKETPLVSAKFDGSLGILYFLNDEPYIATKGGFDNDHALWATEWFRNHVPQWDWKYWQSTSTELFEIVYPGNKIIVDYGWSGLVRLGAVEKHTGKFYPLLENSELEEGFKTAPYIPATDKQKDLDYLSNMNIENEEGFVLYYPKANKHIKIKFEEYMRLHKIITQVSKIGIWESMRYGTSMERVLKDVPDEFFDWVKAEKKKIQDDYDEIYDCCGSYFESIQLKDWTRKEQALFINKEVPKKYRGIVFTMMDGGDYKDLIYKRIRPKGQGQYIT